MCSATLAIIGVQAVSGGLKAYGQYQQGVASQEYYNYLAENSRIRGEAQYKAGLKQAELIQDSQKFEGKRFKSRTAQIQSRQRAVIVANGGILSSVTSEDIASDSIDNARLDELSLRYNADIKSWSATEDAKNKRWYAQQDASNKEFAGAQAKYAGKQQAFGTLLSTATSIAFTGLGGFGSSTSTQGISGFFNGYRAGTPKNAINMGNFTLTP